MDEKEREEKRRIIAEIDEIREDLRKVDIKLVKLRQNFLLPIVEEQLGDAWGGNRTRT